ncbi:MAG TPA: TetR/AcrR family transcriptional regulator [Gemmatimonadaceae bacterium]|nr:TetR/AcrR family transcriptional regulator [Gemmatimonadaceae bacterium]
MPAPLLSKAEVLDRLLDTFREKGYEGASLAELSAATGLVKSSLYHYFPGGKEDMAEQVMAHLDEQLVTGVYEPLRAAGTPAKKLGAMLDTIDAFYEGGRKACLLERMCASVDRTRFRRPLRRAFTAWMDAVESLCLEAGLPRTVARSRAEDFVVRVEGALIVAAGTDDYGVFARTIKDLRSSVLAPNR